jgi:hypothetical protein
MWQERLLRLTQSASPFFDAPLTRRKAEPPRPAPAPATAAPALAPVPCPPPPSPLPSSLLSLARKSLHREIGN